LENDAPALLEREHRRFQRTRVSTRQRATGIVRAFVTPITRIGVRWSFELSNQ
jgi:hypothetical protein